MFPYDQNMDLLRLFLFSCLAHYRNHWQILPQEQSAASGPSSEEFFFGGISDNCCGVMGRDAWGGLAFGRGCWNVLHLLTLTVLPLCSSFCSSRPWRASLSPASCTSGSISSLATSSRDQKQPGLSTFSITWPTKARSTWAPSTTPCSERYTHVFVALADLEKKKKKVSVGDQDSDRDAEFDCVLVQACVWSRPLVRLLGNYAPNSPQLCWLATAKSSTSTSSAYLRLKDRDFLCSSRQQSTAVCLTLCSVWTT